ncbi:ATP-binding cassette domain-containing protein [Rhodoferax aquaticus]|uniref:Cyclolysin secretion/processing ATP-binding protein CyaB n=1 Tax=Rhodoferax aquaticus TaxID=2527691 RepID=A0A515EKI4_9BURK|nr:ATP-binding cassette domain-containing protein [Rhodoferax aquaticus]QDL53177.1 ATP-binding cassette domain-containing protein [Rhodoferax aquaticus]
MNTALPSVEETLRQFEELLSSDVRQPVRKHPMGDVFAACQSAAKAMGLTGNPIRGGFGPDSEAAEVAYALGLNAREVTLVGSWWESDHGTLICRDTASGNPVLVRSCRGRTAMEFASEGYTTGFKPLTQDAAAGLETQATALYAGLPDSSLEFKDILSLVLKPYHFELWIYLALTLVIASLTYVVPVASGLVIDHAVPHRNETLLFAVVAVVVVCNVLMLSLRWTSEMIVQRIEGAAGTDLQAAFLDRLFRLPMKFLSGYNKADLMRRFTAMEGARRSTLRMLVKTCMDLITFLVGLGALTYYYPVGALAVLGVAVLNLSVAFFLGSLSRAAYAEGEAMTANVLTIVYELIANMLPIRMFAAQRRAFMRWRDNFIEMRRRQVRSTRYGDMYAAFQQSLSLLTLCAVFSIVTYSTTTAAPESIGEYVSFVASVSIVTGSVAGMAATVLAYFNLVTSVAMSLPLRTEVPESVSGRKKLPEIRGEIELQGVDFKYGDEQPLILTNFSMRIAPGEYIGIVGPSGCGKSTLVRLFLGLLSPNNGKVFIDRNDLSNVNVEAVRKTFGVVLQDHRMFAGSILENITAGRDLDVDQVLKTLETIGMAGFVKSLPMGIHTVIGENTSLFSGGQNQLMALARALVGGPRLLIFDEATSALDNVSVGKVGAVLDQLAITRIVFTHRLGTLKNCDRIIVMDRGTITQEGSYDQLATSAGSFKNMLHGKA